jgi:hypothetical protein
MQTAAPGNLRLRTANLGIRRGPLADQSFLADRKDFMVAAAVIGMIIHPAREQAFLRDATLLAEG